MLYAAAGLGPTLDRPCLSIILSADPDEPSSPSFSELSASVKKGPAFPQVVRSRPSSGSIEHSFTPVGVNIASGDVNASKLLVFRVDDRPSWS